MKQRHLIRRLPALVAVVVTVAITGAACSSAKAGSGANTASAPGITPTAIELGSNQPLTGPAAPGYGEIGPAINSVFQYINSRGGVYGRKFAFDYKDDAYDPVKTSQVIRQLVLQDNVFAIVGGLGTAPEEAVAPYLTARGIPDLFVETGCTCFNNPAKYPGIFGSFTDYTIEGKILGTYVKQHFPGEKVAYIGQDDDLGNYGYAGLTQVLHVAARQSYDPSTLSAGLTNQISAAKAAGAKVLVSFSIPAATALELLAEAGLGYHPAMVVSEVGSDPGTLAGLLSSFSKGKANGSLDSGLITDSFEPAPSETANPWVQLATKIHGQYDAKEPFDSFYMFGFETAMLTYDAFKAAGRNPTRQGIVSAIEKEGRGFAGPWLAPLGFSATNHDAALGVQLGTLNDNQLTLSGPVYTATDNTPVTVYAGGQPQVPAGF